MSTLFLHACRLAIRFIKLAGTEEGPPFVAETFAFLAP